jgi:hypothetical protein
LELGYLNKRVSAIVLGGSSPSASLAKKEGKKERKKMKLPLRNERQEAFAYHRRCREMACVMSIISFSIESKEV